MKPIEARLETIERLLRDLLKDAKAPKETWVKAGTIMQITGWDKEGLRRARNNKFVKVRKDKGIWYSLESVPAVYLKKTA